MYHKYDIYHPLLSGVRELLRIQREDHDRAALKLFMAQTREPDLSVALAFLEHFKEQLVNDEPPLTSSLQPKPKPRPKKPKFFK